MPISGSALHFWRRHTGFSDQVVNVGVAVVVATTERAVVIVVAAGVARICGNFLNQPLDLLGRRVLYDLALATGIQIVSALVQHGLLICIGRTHGMNSNGVNKPACAGDEDAILKTDVRMVQVANHRSIQAYEQPIP